MGLNGISEAYLYATMKENELKTFRYLITLNTIIYIGLCLFLIDYEAVGLIIANSISMIIRIMICLFYMKNHMQSHKSIFHFIRSTLPSVYSIIGFIITFAMSRVLQQLYYNWPSRNHLVVGGGIQ